MVYIPYDSLNITNEDEKVCSFLINGGFFVRNATLFCGDQMQSEHDLIGFKYDKNFVPFIVLSEQKSSSKSRAPFRDIVTTVFFSQYFRANVGLYVVNEPLPLEIIEFGQKQNPRILVCSLSNFNSNTLPEVSAHFSGLDHFIKITKSGIRTKAYRKKFEILWQLSEFRKIGLIENILKDILSAETPISKEYENAYVWLSKELVTHYSLSLIQIISRTFLVFTPENRGKMLTEWFKSELTETREDGKLTTLENESITVIERLIKNKVLAHKLPHLMNKYLYGGSEMLSSEEVAFITEILNNTSFKEAKRYIEKKIM